MVQAYDAYGRSVLISRADWRTNVLLANLRAHWDEPDALSMLILSALEAGFHADVLEAAEQLHRIDPMAERGATLLGIVLMKCERLDEAERVLTAHVSRHGEAGVILTNLAKVYAERGEARLEDETLWRALQLDPNLDNAVNWYAAKHRERGGAAAELDALRRVAALPGSWRAQLWLARASLAAGDREQALVLYRESLSRTEGDVPALLLEQMSGDLVSHGLLRELVELTAPGFDAARHGEVTGNNLIKAHLDLGQAAAARQVLERLYAVQRPDWGPMLDHWERELAQAELVPIQPPPDGTIPLTILRLKGPVWMGAEPVPGLLPVDTRAGLSLCFLGSTAETAGSAMEGERQLTDLAGRLSRAIPCFLAEQAYFRAGTRAEILAPWVMLSHGAFGLGGQPWTDEEAAGYAGPDSDYVVVTHLRAVWEPWTLQLRLVRTRDAACVGTLGAAFDSESPAEGVRRLADRLLALLAQHGYEPRTPSPSYAVPAGMLDSYLVRLEQMLAIRCFTMEGADPRALSGTREIVAGNLQLCLHNPHSVSTRLLLAQTVRGLLPAHGNAVREFADRVRQLQSHYPLPPEAHATVQRILEEAHAG